MTAPDVRTAAQEQAEQVWRHDQCRSDGNECVECVFRQGAFVDGAVWGAALVTPTRRQSILAAQNALGCDIDGLEGFMPGCQEHEADITEEGLCPNATAAAEAVLALMGGASGHGN